MPRIQPWAVTLTSLGILQTSNWERFTTSFTMVTYHQIGLFLPSLLTMWRRHTNMFVTLKTIKTTSTSSLCWFQSFLAIACPTFILQLTQLPSWKMLLPEAKPAILFARCLGSWRIKVLKALEFMSACLFPTSSPCTIWIAPCANIWLSMMVTLVIYGPTNIVRVFLSPSCTYLLFLPFQ